MAGRHTRYNQFISFVHHHHSHLTTLTAYSYSADPPPPLLIDTFHNAYNLIFWCQCASGGIILWRLIHAWVYWLCFLLLSLRRELETDFNRNVVNTRGKNIIWTIQNQIICRINWMECELRWGQHTHHHLCFFRPRSHMVQSNRNKIDDPTKRIQAIYHIHSFAFFTHYSFRCSLTANLKISLRNAPLNFYWTDSANLMQTYWKMHGMKCISFDLGLEGLRQSVLKIYPELTHTHTHSYPCQPTPTYILPCKFHGVDFTYRNN